MSSKRILKPIKLAVLTAALSIGAGALPPIQTADAAGVQVTSTSTNERYKLGLNKSLIVNLPSDAYDILVANPAVADAVTRTSRRLYIFGKAVGETNVFVFGQNGEQIASFDLVIERDVAGLEDYIKQFLPSSEIKVQLINDNVVLTGTVDTPLDAKRAAELANLFVSGGEATTGQYSQTASGGSSDGGVDINNPDSERRSSQIVNMIKIIGEDQVTLKVTVAEVSRSVMKQLGMKMIGSGNVDGISWGAISDPSFGLGMPAGAASGIGGSLIDAYINAMEQAGVMKTLAEPTLTAVSGEPAEFHVGGTFNLVTGRTSAVTDDNRTGQTLYTVEKLDYGIMLQFRPVVLSPGRISLKVRTSVSEPTFEGSSSLGGGGGRTNDLIGMNALSIRKRLADTTVELPSGGSMMIAGLVRDDVRQAVNGLPGLSKIPILGTLFRSKDFVRNETELVILVTPYLTKPVARSDLAKPDDNFNAAGDGPGYFLGRVNRVYGSMQTNKPKGRYHGVVGFIYK